MRSLERRARQGIDEAVRPLLVVWAVGLALLAIARLQRVATAEQLFLDPMYYAGIPWYIGTLSSLGILGWSVAVSGCVATAFVATVAGRVGAARAFRSGAVVLTLQLLDDLFLIHSSLLPASTGLPKVVWQLALVGATAGWLVPSRRELERTRWGLLLAGGGGLGLSLGIDAIAVEGGPWYLLAEDGPKFLGVLAVAAWSVMSAADIIRSVTSRVATEAASPLQVDERYSVK